MRRLSKWSGGKAIVKTACFLLLLALALGWADEVLALKSLDGIYQMLELYELKKNTADVLVVGSSHAYFDINTGALWDEYGVAAYNLGGAEQGLWNSYYHIKEALKTQTPKLIVLEGFGLIRSKNSSALGTIFLNTSGMRWSLDKLWAVRESFPPEERIDYLLEWSQYHTRYRSLSRADFLAYYGDQAKFGCWKGDYLTTQCAEVAWPEEIQTEERAPLLEEVEEWYCKIIELAQSNDIPLLIVVNPYPGIIVQDQALYNSASDIAAEYGVPFVNYNQDFSATNLNLTTDYQDVHHMNVWGSRKFTKQIGQYLKECYDLPDRRGNPAYQSWEDNAQYIRAYVRNAELVPDIAPEAAASLLRDPDFACAVSVSGNGAAAYAPLLEALGIPAVEPGMWLVSGGEVLWASGASGKAYFELDYHDLKLTALPSGNEMAFDRDTLQTVSDGVSVLVYDTVTQAKASFLTFDTTALS